ncbi:CYTH domain-containing protein [Patescibacteria group bacterium]|nr:CYTH domain-containing protein [Patescibacteria group bacterium]
MDTEYEATFSPVEKADIRQRLTKAGALLIKPEFLQKRVVFTLPSGQAKPGAWLRVRDEADKITLSYKQVINGRIEDQKEICLQVSNFTKAVELLTAIGCQKKAYQESTRELWKLSDVEITIDQWPWLEPFVEIEGSSEQMVKEVSLALGFDYSQAKFCAIGHLYSLKYNLSEDIINNQTPEIVFGGVNPFLNRS